MKRFLIIAVLSLFALVTARAQKQDFNDKHPGLERIHAAKMAYITDKLRLTSEQSANFVPVYNEYEHELREIRRSFKDKYRQGGGQDMDDETARHYIDDNLDYQQKVLDLKKKYNDRFLKVLTPQQVADLYQAEREFKQMLLQRVKQRRSRWQ